MIYVSIALAAIAVICWCSMGYMHYLNRIDTYIINRLKHMGNDEYPAFVEWWNGLSAWQVARVVL